MAAPTVPLSAAAGSSPGPVAALYSVPGFWSLLGTLAWIALIAALVWWQRHSIVRLVMALQARLQAGAVLKIAGFELGAAPYLPHHAAQGARFGRIQIYREGAPPSPEQRDTTYAQRFPFHASREPFRGPHRNLFLVHRLQRSQRPGQLYDVFVYLVPSEKFGSLAAVQSVEYYFGKHWDYQIFKSTERSSGFLVMTSAFAPFSCTARVTFTDHDPSQPQRTPSTQVFLHRYVDFDMALGALASPPE